MQFEPSLFLCGFFSAKLYLRTLSERRICSAAEICRRPSCWIKYDNGFMIDRSFLFWRLLSVDS